MSGNVALFQGLKEVILAIEFRHFNIGVTYFMKSMGIAAGAFDEAIL